MVAGLILYQNRMFYHDDAYISLRYALNAIHGNGLVWNPGEYVQGYSNFLYLALTGLLGLMGFELQLATRAISAASALLLLGVLAHFPTCARDGGEHPLRYISVVLVATAAPILIWTLGGLETVFYTLWCTAGATSVLRSMQSDQPARSLLLAGLFFSLAMLTRLDGMVFLAISLVFVSAAASGDRLRNAVLLLAPCALILGGYLSWAKSYYGDYLPNTFYVKAGELSVLKLASGAAYLADYALTAPFLFVLAALAGLALLARGRSRPWSWRMDFAASYLATLSLGYSLYVVSVGGDHMPSYRLLVPVIPLAAMLVFVGLQGLVRPGESRKVAAVYTILTLLAGLQLFYGRPLSPREEDQAARKGTIVGKFIAKNWPKSSLIALNTAGSTPFFATNHIFIDMLGLNDRHIAHRETVKTNLPQQKLAGHAKGDGAYVLSREPDYIIVGPSNGAMINRPWFLSDLEMKDDPRFAQNYRHREVRLTKSGERARTGGLRFQYYERVGKSR